MSKIREEVRNRTPRLMMSLVIALIFWVISMVVPVTIPPIDIPGLEIGASSLTRIITAIITGIFLIRALSDALVLGDIVTDVVVRRLGIRTESSPKRAARDFIYIIVVMLIATGLVPIIDTFGGSARNSLTLLTIYSALGLILLLIYDMGRILYRILERHAETLADRIAGMSERTERGN